MITVIRKDGTKIKQLDCFTRPRGTGKYDPTADPYRDYLQHEIAPAVWKHIELARARWGIIPIKPAAIDEILNIQAESDLKAIRYIKWRFLGSCNYIEVYGKDAQRDYAENSANKEIAYLHEKMDLILKLLSVQNSTENNIIQIRSA